MNFYCGKFEKLFIQAVNWPEFSQIDVFYQSCVETTRQWKNFFMQWGILIDRSWLQFSIFNLILPPQSYIIDLHLILKMTKVFCFTESKSKIQNNTSSFEFHTWVKYVLKNQFSVTISSHKFQARILCFSRYDAPEGVYPWTFSTRGKFFSHSLCKFYICGFLFTVIIRWNCSKNYIMIRQVRRAQ